MCEKARNKGAKGHFISAKVSFMFTSTNIHALRAPKLFTRSGESSCEVVQAAGRPVLVARRRASSASTMYLLQRCTAPR